MEEEDGRQTCGHVYEECDCQDAYNSACTVMVCIYCDNTYHAE